VFGMEHESRWIVSSAALIDDRSTAMFFADATHGFQGVLFWGWSARYR
jgi:hypothetical protein